MSTESSFEVVAAVSPKSLGGRSLFEYSGKVESGNVDQFRSEQDTTRAACHALSQAGFRILSVGETSISIGGTRAQFEEFLGRKLKKKRRKVRDSAPAEFFEAVGEEPEPAALAAPSSLRAMIEGIALAEPPEYFASPLPPVAPVHPDAYRYLRVPDEVAVVLQATRIHRTGTTGRGVVVAMIDTGFYRHPFFNHHGYRVNPTLLGPGASDPAEDSNGHGTGESANIFAVAPDARLIPIKGGGDPTGSMNTAMAATPMPQIITNSWGYDIDVPGASLSPYLKTLEAAVADAVSKGIVVCFAAGNGHHAFPGSHPDVISVGGVHVNYPDLDLEASSYASSFDSSLYAGRAVPDLCGLTGKAVSIDGSTLAPSLMLPVQDGATLDGISPTTGTASDGWGLFSGTSAACPQVAGVCALLLEKDPTLTPTEVKAALVKSARDVRKGSTQMGDTAGVGPDAATGAGLVNAKWAWLIAMGGAGALEAVDGLQPEESSRLHDVVLKPARTATKGREIVADLMEVLRSR